MISRSQALENSLSKPCTSQLIPIWYSRRLRVLTTAWKNQGTQREVLYSGAVPPPFTDSQPFEVGKPITSQGVGKVIKSKNDNIKEGQIVTAMLDWAEYTLITEPTSKGVEIVDNKYNVPLSAYTGVLGMPGFTAYALVPLIIFLMV